jgi:hypothetical protein
VTAPTRTRYVVHVPGEGDYGPFWTLAGARVWLAVHVSDRSDARVRPEVSR